MNNDNALPDQPETEVDNATQTVIYKGRQMGHTEMKMLQAQRLALGMKLMALADQLRAQDVRVRRFSTITAAGPQWLPGTARHVFHVLEGWNA